MVVVLLIAFLVMPILEIYVILQVGQSIGAWPTVALLLGISLAGAWLMRREGRRAWTALREALAAGRLPSRELADGALLLIGGTLLLTPGFLTDAAGLLLVLPPTRAVARRLLLAWVARRATVVAARGAGIPPRRFAGRSEGDGSGGPPGGTAGRDGPGRIVPGEVVAPDHPDDPRGGAQRPRA